MSVVTSISPLLIALFSSVRLLFIGQIINNFKENNQANVRSLYTYIYIFQFVCITMGLIVLFTLQHFLINDRIGNNVDAISKAHKFYWYELIAVFIIGIGFVFNWIFYSEDKNILLAIILLIGIGINIIASSIFILIFNMGLTGAGLGTLISTSITLGLKITFIISKKKYRKLIMPKINFLKQISIKRALLKWLTIPYELMFFTLEFIFFYIVNWRFNNQLIIYGLVKPFIYMFAGGVGMSQIIMREHKKNNLKLQNKKEILKISRTRFGIVSIVGLGVIAIILLGTPLYQIDFNIKLNAYYVVIGILMSVALFSPYYNLSFNVALLSPRHSTFYISDLFGKVMGIILAIIIGVYSNSLIAFALVLSAYQIIGGAFPFIIYRPLKIKL